MLSAAPAPARTRRPRASECSLANTKIEGLAEALAEGLSTGHPDMPEFVFAAEDVGAIIDYLQSIQQQ